MWLYLPDACTSSLSAPEREVWSWGSDSLHLMLAQSCTSRGKSMQAPYWRRACKTASWTRPLSGRTYTPSTAARGVESWIASLAATPANRSAPQASDGAPKTHDTYGPTSPRSSSKWNLSGASLRTLPLILELDSEKSDPIYTAWATTLRRDSLRRQRSGHPTSANASSSLHTVRPAARLWPTPRTNGATGISQHGDGGPDLQTSVSVWQTPATDSFRSRSGDRKDEMGLDQQARYQWATPASGAQRGGGQNQETRKEQGHAVNLEDQVTAFPHSPHPPQTAPDGVKSSPTGRKLNPRFVEWLMGWPVGWTALEPLATASYLSWQQKHSERLLQSLGLTEVAA